MTSLAWDQLSLPSEQSPSRQATSWRLASPWVRAAKVQRARGAGLCTSAEHGHPGNERPRGACHASGIGLGLTRSSSQQPDRV